MNLFSMKSHSSSASTMTLFSVPPAFPLSCIQPKDYTCTNDLNELKLSGAINSLKDY